MTAALTTPAPVVPAPNLTWWLFRLHRPALYVWTGAVVVLGAALLWLWGPLTDASVTAWEHFDACMTATCGYDQDAVLIYKDVYQYTTLAVVAIPLLVAAWAGASLIGRELENGTAHLAWTQGVSPARWLTAKLAVPAALVTTGTGLLVLLHHLVWSAGEGKIDSAKVWYDFATFYTNGPALVALALAGLAIGTLAGLVQRRSLAALGTALCATAALWLALQAALPHLWPTVTSVAGLRNGGPQSSGLTADSGMLTSTGGRIGDPNCGSSIYPACRRLYDKLDAVGFYSDYHPRSHFWPLQLTATGILLAFTALLVVVAFRLLSRRTAGPAPVGKETAV